MPVALHVSLIIEMFVSSSLAFFGHRYLRFPLFSLLPLVLFYYKFISLDVLLMVATSEVGKEDREREEKATMRCKPGAEVRPERKHN